MAHTLSSFAPSLLAPSLARRNEDGTRSGVVGSLLSYGRSQTFLSGSNLASSPPDDVFQDDGPEVPQEPDSEDDWTRDDNPLVRAVAREDEEFLVGSVVNWKDGYDDELPTTTANTLPHHVLSPLPSSPPRRHATSNHRLAPSGYVGRGRFTSTPTPPTPAVRIGSRRPKGSKTPPSAFSPPSSLENDAPIGHPASAPHPSHAILSTSPSPQMNERTPLISVIPPRSYSGSSTPSTIPSEGTLTPVDQVIYDTRSIKDALTLPASRSRRPSSVARPQLPPGKSTYNQTLFNSIAILLGIGMLSCPLAFACAGWIAGTLLLIFYGFLTCYTAKILAGIILSDGRLRTYADIGQAAFGPRSNAITSFLFCLELFTVSVILIVLFSDSLHELMPQYSSNSYKVLGLLVIIPTSFLPLRVLSFASVLGIISTFMLVFVLFEDGLAKTQAPGSLWEGMPTEWIPSSALTGIPMSFGLFMAGYSGHAVIPSIVRDMKDPSQYKSMLNRAFFVATAIYIVIGGVGYRMFGDSVSEEVSQDLLRTPGFNKLLNKIALWMLVASPLTKFSLSARPMNVTLEILFGIEETTPVPKHNKPLHREDHHGAGYDSDNAHHQFYLAPSKEYVFDKPSNVERRKRFGRVFERIALTVLVVLVAIYVPDFSTATAFLGAFSAFLLCIIGPLAAKIAIENNGVGWIDGVSMLIAVGMAIWATYISITAV